MPYPFPVNSSGVKTGSTQLSVLPSLVAGIDMISPSTGTATLTIYDSENSTTSGKTVLAEMEVDAGMPSCNHEYGNLIIANRGIYITLDDTSGTASYIIRYALA